MALSKAALSTAGPLLRNGRRGRPPETAHAGQSFKTLLRRLSKAGFEQGLRAARRPSRLVGRALRRGSPPRAGHRDPSRPLPRSVDFRCKRFKLPSGAAATIRAHSSGAFVTLTATGWLPRCTAAIRCAAAVVRNLRDTVPPPKAPPGDGLAWRERLVGRRTAPSLEALAEHLWELGIPVVPLDVLPAPSFQGMACIVEDRPVILLGHKHDEPGRVAFVIAHEAGHIAAGDCTAGRPIVDEEPGNRR